MNDRLRRSFAWAVLAVCLALTVSGLILLVANAEEGGGDLDLVDSAIYPALLVFPIFGTLIVTYRPENRMGLLFSLSGLVWTVDGFMIEFAKYDLITNPGALVAGSFAAWLSNWLWVPEIGLMTTFALLLFPTGHLPSRRWAGVGWLAAGGILLACLGSAFQAGAMEGWDPDLVQNPLGLTALKAPLGAMTWLGVGAIAGAAAASVTALLLRLRRATGIEREQLKWFAFAASLLALALFVTLAGYTVSQEAGQKAAYSLVTILGLPIAAGVAILRYHLYDIDILINRTLVYGMLTACLAGLYAASLQLFKFLFEVATGQGSEATIVLTTLVLAAMFTPIKNRLQALVDRHFGHVRDPMKELQAYADHLRSVVQVFDSGETARQFVEHAVDALHAVSGALYLRKDGGVVRVAEAGGTVDGAGLRIPMLANGEEVGFLSLSRRPHGAEYSPEELEMLESTANHVADAIVLAQRAAFVSPRTNGLEP